MPKPILIPHDSWDSIDSTKIGAFIDCPRRYFLEYMLGWRSSYLNNHLAFGKAIHSAMEVMDHLKPTPIDIDEKLLDFYGVTDEEDILSAGSFCVDVITEDVTWQPVWKAFLKTYQEDIPDDDWDLYHPKTPERAAMALLKYRWENRIDTDQFELVTIDGRLATEVGGKINIAPGITLSFRIDKIMKNQANQWFIWDYKTGTSMHKWIQEWESSFQFRCYLYALHLYRTSGIGGAIIEGFCFHKTKDVYRNDIKNPTRHIEFLRHRLFFSVHELNEWASEAAYWIDLIKCHQEMALNEAGNKIFRAFPKSRKSCTWHYGAQCQYYDVCAADTNPLKRLRPMQFDIDFWDPLKEEPNVFLNLRKEK